MKIFPSPQQFNDPRNYSFRGVLTTSDIQTAYYNKLNRLTPVVVFKERFFLIPTVIYLRKYSCLRLRIDRNVQKLISSGLMDYWINLYKESEYRKMRLKKKPQTLTLSQLEGILIICGVSYCLAFCIFVFEIYWSRLMH